jgi:acyl-CoA dehydrogenase
LFSLLASIKKNTNDEKNDSEFISNEMDHIDEWEKNGMVSREIWKRAGELGLLCIDMPEIYGGGGLDFTFNALLIEEFAKISGPGFSLHSDIVAPIY